MGPCLNEKILEVIFYDPVCVKMKILILHLKTLSSKSSFLLVLKETKILSKSTKLSWALGSVTAMTDGLSWFCTAGKLRLKEVRPLAQEPATP